jgi:putative transposase
MAGKRRRFSPTFKAKVALEAVQGLKTISELAQKHKLHPTQINLWKKQLVEGAENFFAEGGRQAKAENNEPQVTELYEQIGRLNVQLEWLKKKVATHSE